MPDVTLDDPQRHVPLEGIAVRLHVAPSS